MTTDTEALVLGMRNFI